MTAFVFNNILLPDLNSSYQFKNTSNSLAVLANMKQTISKFSKQNSVSPTLKQGQISGHILPLPVL